MQPDAWSSQISTGEGALRTWWRIGSQSTVPATVNPSLAMFQTDEQFRGQRPFSTLQNAVKRQSVGRQTAVNRRLRGCKCQSDPTAKSHSKRRQTAVSRIRQTAVNRRLRGCKCQSDDSEIALKTPSNGSQSAVKRQSIGAYGAANAVSVTAGNLQLIPHLGDAQRKSACSVLQSTTAVISSLTGLENCRADLTAKSRIFWKRRQTAVSRQSIGAYGAANVSQMTAKSHSKRRQTAVSRQANGSQSALTGLQMSVR